MGRKGAGKSSLINLILGVPDDMPGAAQVTNGGASQITSYATFLGSLPVQVWDTPGLDEELDGHHLRNKIKDWLHLVSSSHCKKDLETERPYLMVPLAIQVVWCIRVGEITDPVAWQQFRAIYEECRCQGVITIVLINQVPMEAESDWEVPCENQLQRLGLSVGPGLLISVRSHDGVSSPEHKDDVRALSHLIRQHARSQNLPGGFTHKLDFGHPRGVDTFLTAHHGELTTFHSSFAYHHRIPSKILNSSADVVGWLSTPKARAIALSVTRIFAITCTYATALVT